MAVRLGSEVAAAQKKLSAVKSDYMKQLSGRVKQYQSAESAAMDQVKSAGK